jgi:hypothetical protein
MSSVAGVCEGTKKNVKKKTENTNTQKGVCVQGETGVQRKERKRTPYLKQRETTRPAAVLKTRGGERQ